MLCTLTLILIAPVWADWVEISQHHYRKPIRTQAAFTTPDRTIFVEETTKAWTYNNRSVTEHYWNKSPARTPFTGHAKRVQYFGTTTVKPTQGTRLEDNDHSDLDDRDYDMKSNAEIIKPNKVIRVNENGKQKGTIEKVPNIGNVKRVQLTNTPVKSPSIKMKGERNPNYNKHSTFEDEDFYEDNNSKKFQQRFDANKLQKPQVVEKPLNFDDDDEDDITTTSKKKSMQSLRNYTTFLNDFRSTKPTFITETEDYFHETQNNRFYKTTSTMAPGTQKTKIFSNTHINNEQNTSSKGKGEPQISEGTMDSRVNKPNRNPEINKFDTESHENKINNLENEIHTIKSAKQDLNRATHKQKEEIVYKKEFVSNKITPTNDKVQTIENLIKFMRVVADTISRNSRKTFGGKMQYLHELKDSILANIEERIDATWPDDTTAGARRHSRSAHASPRGHVQFPSSESALMTISFLTFAVFLIKLVLQVIQTYKHKTMMVAPLVVASGRNVFTRHGRN